MNRIENIPQKGWNAQQATDFYKIDRWGQGYFAVNEKGNLCICEPGKSEIQVDLKIIVDELEKRKIEPPILIRVMNILEDRIKTLATCFQKAIETYEYQSKYVPLFPIKVNQQKHVIESIRKFGKPFNIGLEAGSKAELLAILALSSDEENLLICNGYKDSGFVQMVGMAHKMGKKIIPVIEKYSEIESFITYYRETGIMPNIGVRLKIASRGMGQWANSGGDRSKFGLRILDIVRLVDRLKDEGLLPKLKLLHFHIGSQISEIGVVKRALTEAARVYVELIALGVNMDYFDVGGGLGIDYDGSSHNTFNSINYSIQEYANDVIYRIQQVCDQHGVQHPVILSESGRFLAAHYSFLVTNIASYSKMHNSETIDPLVGDTSPVIEEMFSIYEEMNQESPSFLEHYHDAIQVRSEAVNLFNLGYLTLTQRAEFEKIFWSAMHLIQKHLDSMDHVPNELEDLELNLTDTFYANFSLFQSLPDAWAINQIFPIIPIHRLDERPTRRVIIADLTCDSDGSIKQYVGKEETRPFVWMHDQKPEEPYYIGIFLTGAYQETLGELHNLFGDTHAVHLDLLGENQYKISSFLKGDLVQDVLGYVGYSSDSLLSLMREQIENSVHAGKLSLEESASLMEQFEDAMKGYTYFRKET